MSITWITSDEMEPDLVKQIIAVESINELAISKVYIPYQKTHGEYRFQFFNIDPVNWNLFMFPYHTRKIRKVLDPVHVAKHGNDVAALIGKRGCEYIDFSSDKILTQAEIKISRSSKLNTLYLYFYNIIAPSETKFDYEMREMNFLSVEDAKCYFREYSAEFASNIPTIVEVIINARK